MIWNEWRKKKSLKTLGTDYLAVVFSVSFLIQCSVPIFYLSTKSFLFYWGRRKANSQWVHWFRESKYLTVQSILTFKQRSIFVEIKMLKTDVSKNGKEVDYCYSVSAVPPGILTQTLTPTGVELGSHGFKGPTLKLRPLWGPEEKRIMEMNMAKVH